MAEVHARPFQPADIPARVLHFAFLTDGERAAADRAALAGLCVAEGVPPPPADAKHHSATLFGAGLRWEQHTEFTTYTWTFRGRERAPFERLAGELAAAMGRVPQAGPLLVAIDLHMLAEEEGLAFEDVFDPTSLAVSKVDGGAAMVATDFRTGADGFVRLLALDRHLSPAQAGVLVQRLLEIETYRTFALLGLPEAQRLSPAVRRIEVELDALTTRMTSGGDPETDHHLLDRLTRLAAELESLAAESSWRFGASRAYDEILRERLAALAEEALPGHPTLSLFLARRLGPAMRTCEAIVARQSDLAQKLARAAQLLRTRVDIEMERQNRDLLAAMNDRARMQLRLQQTVEGLSIAAVSYYVLGLLGYAFKGAKDAGVMPFEPGIATALALPAVVAGVALAVWRIRRSHPDH
jgi:uncharacterized membrane-anchored protein